MAPVFPESEELKKIIESHDWTLYDVSNPPEGRAYTWEELNRTIPPNQYELGGQYMFVPIPKKGQTLREAYTPTKGLGPSLVIEDSSKLLYAEIRPKINGATNVAVFSRLFFGDEKCSFVSSPKTDYLRKPDIVVIKTDDLVDTFRKYFRIVSPEEYGLSAPIPMPIVPERN